MNVRRVVLLGLLANVALVVLCLAAYEGKPDWFVKFGENGAYTPRARQVLGPDVAVPLDDGHDGQGYWLQARDPLLLDGDGLAATFDRPAYRAQRMLYPTLASPFRVFGEEGVLWGLVLVNLAVVAAGTLWAARLALAAGAPAKAGLAFALNPLVAVSLVMDFADALALAALVAVALALRRGEWRWAVVAGCAAVLAKDVSGVALLGVVAVWPLAGRRRWSILLVPATVAGGWALYVRWRLGWPASQVQELTVAPFWGYLDALHRGWSHAGNWGDAAFAVALLVGAAVIARRWWGRRTLELTMALPFALLVPFLTATVVDLTINSFRVLAPAVTFAVIDWYAFVADRAPAAHTAMDGDGRPSLVRPPG